MRTEQAKRTRLRILEAARELFHTHGYATTTIGAISKAAGVSPDTVYDTFRSKRGLLTHLIDSAGLPGGADRMTRRLLDETSAHAIRREVNQQRQIAVFAAEAADELERSRDLDDIVRGAAATDKEIAALRHSLNVEQRRAAIKTVASWIRERGPLREGMPTDQAAAVMWTLTAPEVHHMLRVSWQWTAEQYRNWLRRTLTDALLPAPVTRSQPDAEERTIYPKGDDRLAFAVEPRPSIKPRTARPLTVHPARPPSPDDAPAG